MMYRMCFFFTSSAHTSDLTAYVRRHGRMCIIDSPSPGRDRAQGVPRMQVQYPWLHGLVRSCRRLPKLRGLRPRRLGPLDALSAATSILLEGIC